MREHHRVMQNGAGKRQAGHASLRPPVSTRGRERQFVREVLARKATPEVEAFLAAAAQRSHQARNADFLQRFRCCVDAVVACQRKAVGKLAQ